MGQKSNEKQPQRTNIKATWLRPESDLMPGMFGIRLYLMRGIYLEQRVMVLL